MKHLINFLPTFITVFFMIAAFDVKINFSPFSVKVQNPILGFGLLFLTVGLMLTIYSFEKQGYKKGYSQSTNDIIETLKKELNNSQNGGN